MKVPLMDLKAQCAPIMDEINKAIQKVIDKQAFILGEDVEILEKEIAAYCGVKYAIGVNSGTDALILALNAAGVKEGDEVITTPFTFVATAEAIVRVGAKPVFVDVDPQTFNINPELIEEKITGRTKAIMPVHIYGLPADMDPILELAQADKLKVIEDCAQSVGSEYKGRKVGSMGDAAAFSFFPGKNLGAFGDGGIITTNDAGIHDTAKILRNHGSSKKYLHDIIGYNTRLDNLQAAILSVKLKHLESWHKGRIKNAAYYFENLKGLPVDAPYVPDGYRHTYHLYVLKSNRAHEIMEYLNNNGVETRVYYPVPLH
ncbi:MAG: DegT/DnrJ/EryC1/StrS family aminotransferase, partial [Candidatus Omnitrophota bacterium]